MEHLKFNNIQRRSGVDVGWHESNIEPINREGCVGKSGINASYTFDMILEIAYKNNKPNIIIKNGKKGKWYLKNCPKEQIEDKIKKQKKFRKTKHCEMYIIDW